MAVSDLNLTPTILSSFSSSRCFYFYLYRNPEVGFNRKRDCPKRSLLCSGFVKKAASSSFFGIGVSVYRVSRKSDFESNNSKWILNATTDTRILDIAAATATVEIPVTCYQVVGVPDKAEKDEIVKSVMQLKNAQVEEGYTMDAVMSRQDLLMDVRDKLLFEPEYAGNVREKIPPKSSLRIPWAWLSGALCLLQEVGEEKLVLDIGRAALQHPDAKPYSHDVLLSMALAECALAKIGFERNKVSLGFEALARAQCLLRCKISLGKMALLSQIEESLEELAPACTLELLGMLHSPENAERRRGAIAALRELLRQGLDVETSCRVQDWPCFLSQALDRLMATEIVDLLPWDDLALVRKNKKSLESQNQRAVINFNCFYLAILAHIALGFSSKQTELVNKAKTICECLMASESIDLKFEEAFCLFLLGQGNKDQVVEKLRQIEYNSNPATRSLVPGKEIKDVSGAKPSLETWLKDSVLAIFSDTRDCTPLVSFFGGERRAIASKKSRIAAQATAPVSHRPLSDIAMKRMDAGETIPYMNSSQHFRSAVKQLAPTDPQSSLILLTKNASGSNVNEPSVQLKRDLGVYNRGTWESWLERGDLVGKISFVGVLGCIVFTTFKLSGMNVGRMRIASRLTSDRTSMGTSTLVWTTDSSLDRNVHPVYISQSGIFGRLRNLLSMIKVQFGNRSYTKRLQGSRLAASISSSIATISRKQMPVEEAEDLVKHWQAIKAKALGPGHQVHSLSEVLDESMLAEWQALADAAKAQSSYWRFVLLQLSILQAHIFSDGYGVEIAKIEALIEEAAELVDESLQKNPNYYSTYKILYVLKRQDDGSWRFCQGDIQTT
ncbi:plastid division protein CDP1, chloroplastic [Populus alba]|uniref:Plastid division protein CDP1, chloroplastic-like isoform X1 n=1 Tax=Populus alba TaxID=43335 RepID=A0A4U5MNE6_POPAL|nr:plastid division protein CDP1, chloroplastic-like [Populus alba]TKR71087.1 plastid division protein CDP1, chloroplastic-like isoform X1 [Populus alba]